MSGMPHTSNSVFWIDVDKIKPNPYQPRQHFDEATLIEMSESIRLYGILQPLVVTRQERMTEEGGMQVEYEIIAGERRLRASKLAGLKQVPAVIRTGDQTDKMKLELAIIENLQREDLNAIDRAVAFRKLHEQFGLTHADIGKKMGKSREYISNSLRILNLPPDMQAAIAAGQMAEGHARPLLMLRDNLDEQLSVFQEILVNKISVREAERIARRVAKDKVRKPDKLIDDKTERIEKEFTKRFGTRVHIQKRTKGKGGKIMIDFTDPADLEKLLELVKNQNLEKAADSPVGKKPVQVVGLKDAQTNNSIPQFHEKNKNQESSGVKTVDPDIIGFLKKDIQGDVDKVARSSYAASNQVAQRTKELNSFSIKPIPENNSGQPANSVFNSQSSSLTNSPEITQEKTADFSLSAQNALDNPLQKAHQQPFVAPIPVPPPPGM